MAQQRAWGPTFDSVRRAADTALQSSEGINIYFRIARYELPQNCATASRSFQNSFCALRARARRLSEKRLGEYSRNRLGTPAISDASGDYDSLVCERRELENGEWVVRLIPSHMHLGDVEIVDIASGKKLGTFDYEARMRELAPVIIRKEATQAEWDEYDALIKRKREDEGITASPWFEDEAGNVLFPRPLTPNTRNLTTSLAQLEEHRAPLDDLVDAVAAGGSIFGED